MPSLNKDTLFSFAIDQYLQYLSFRRGCSTSTILTYKSTLGQFIAYTGDLPLKELSIELIDKYAESLMSLSYKSKTFRNKLTPIRSFVKYLYIKDVIDIKPEKIELPAEKEQEANFLDEEEMTALIKACICKRDKALVLFMLRSGLRVSELADARTTDLYKRSFIVRQGKGGKTRVTFITPEAERAIKAYHKTLPATPYYMFPNKVGSKLSRQYITRIVTACAIRARIDKHVSPHTLRHSFATDLLMRGARIEDVQPMMGHSNMRTTRIYAHFTNEYLHARYDKITGAAAGVEAQTS